MQKIITSKTFKKIRKLYQSSKNKSDNNKYLLSNQLNFTLKIHQKDSTSQNQNKFFFKKIHLKSAFKFTEKKITHAFHIYLKINKKSKNIPKMSLGVLQKKNH